jgi:hypothetical protein
MIKTITLQGHVRNRPDQHMNSSYSYPTGISLDVVNKRINAFAKSFIVTSVHLA